MQTVDCECGNITFMLVPRIVPAKGGPVYRVTIICAKCGKQRGSMDGGHDSCPSVCYNLRGPIRFDDGTTLEAIP